jgi:hypothetical protein
VIFPDVNYMFRDGNAKKRELEAIHQLSALQKGAYFYW